MTAPVDVLAIAAHPDDAEVGCGGALLVAAQAGHSVVVADLTDGELSTAGTPEQRVRERDRAGELLGLSARVGLGLPDAGLGMDAGHRDALVHLLRDLRPRLVLAPFMEDRHPDHAAAGRLAREAFFLAGVAKLGRGRAHRPERLYHYSLHHSFRPTFVLDVSAVWERRMEAVLAYESQFGHAEDRRLTEIGEPAFLELLTARAAVYGSMVGVARGEPYLARGPLPTSSLPGLEGSRGERPPAYRAYL